MSRWKKMTIMALCKVMMTTKKRNKKNKKKLWRRIRNSKKMKKRRSKNIYLKKIKRSSLKVKSNL